MNKKTMRVAMATVIAAAGQHVMAEAPSYNYVQFDYVVSGDTQLKSSGLSSESLDVEQGFALQGAFEIGDYMLVMGRHHALDYDDSDGTFLGVDNAVINDMTFIGVGAHLPIADMLDVYGAVGFSRPTYTNVAGEGYGLEVGARVNVEMIEAALWYNMGSTDTKAGSQTVDIDPELLGLDVAISFAPQAPQLVLGYVDATHELKAGATDADIEYDYFSIGVRKSF
ncbi:MAG: hypothetical protein MI751_06990 [Pseudomonadales bacterium]|nr:hypothetical protein [Pseudomonadales bacterium]